jgi:hypothetical protein
MVDCQDDRRLVQLDPEDFEFEAIRKKADQILEGNETRLDFLFLLLVLARGPTTKSLSHDELFVKSKDWAHGKAEQHKCAVLLCYFREMDGLFSSTMFRDIGSVECRKRFDEDTICHVRNTAGTFR